MATVLEQSQNASQGQSSTAESVVGGASTVANMAGGEGRELYNQVGSNWVNKKVADTDLYKNHIEKSERLKNFRKNNADTISKINEGSGKIDAFFTRIKDRVVDSVKSAFHRTKKALHIGQGSSAPTPSGGVIPPGTDGVVANTETALAKTGTLVGQEAGAASTSTENIAAKSVGVFGKALGALGKVATVVAIPLTLVLGAFQTKKKIQENDGHGAAQVSGSTVGGIFGGLTAGALEGLVIGGMAGTVVPVIGSIVLGIGGAIVGGYLGSKATDAVIGNKLQASLDKKKAMHAAQASGVVATAAMNEQEAGGPESTRYRAQIMRERQQAAQGQALSTLS